MNYYNPNFYQNYQQPQSALNGKVVDNVDLVRATEVPFGSYGIFPRSDFNEVYIKKWNQDGTTNIIRYTPKEAISPQGTSLDEILGRLENLEMKINTLTEQPKEEIFNEY